MSRSNSTPFRNRSAARGSRKSDWNQTPFTVPELQVILTKVIKSGSIVLPLPGKGDLEQLTRTSNSLAGRFRFGIEVANHGASQQERARNAVQDMMTFFELRRKEWTTKGACTPKVIADEQNLYGEFARFLRAMNSHKFELSMDMSLLMPKIENWHPFADIIADSFRLAMQRANPSRRFGNSNEGPVARFVAAVIPRITGESPTVGAVSKRLKDSARAKRKTAR